jgi:hypothetical protein
MPSRSPCSKVSARAMTRAAIAFLEGLPEGKSKVKTGEVIKQLADSLGCTVSRSSDQYAKFKARWKKALEAFRDRVDDPSIWTKFKTKYEKGNRASAEVVKIIQQPIAQGELSTLDQETISKLAKMCKEKKSREDIDKSLKKHKITLLGGQPISKINKTDLCDAILTLAGDKLISSNLEPKSSPCDEKATVAQLKAYIQSRGWSVPSKARKAEICEFIAKMESKAGSPIVAPLSAPTNVPFTLPQGYGDCTASRTLSKQKIKEWVSAQGWDKEKEFEGFPADRKDKATWCDFLSRQIASHQVRVPPPPTDTAQTTPVACYQDQDWKTVEDVEANLAACPPDQACGITKKRCMTGEDAEKLGLERYDVKLKNGRTFTTYVNKDQLRLLEPNLRNFIETGKRPSTPKGAQITAPIEEPKPKTKSKIVFRPGKVQYGEEEQKRQAEASVMLSKLIGEETEIEAPEEKTESKAYSKEYTNALRKKIKEELGLLVEGLERNDSPYPKQKRVAEYINTIVENGLNDKTNYLATIREHGPPQKWSTNIATDFIGKYSDFMSKWYNVEPEEEEPEIEESRPEPVVEQEPIVSTVVVSEEPSAIVKLRQRLKDVRVQPQPPPIQIVRAESALAKATAACAGIQS